MKSLEFCCAVLCDLDEKNRSTKLVDKNIYTISDDIRCGSFWVKVLGILWRGYCVFFLCMCVSFQCVFSALLMTYSNVHVFMQGHGLFSS